MKFQETMNNITKRQFATVDALYGSEDNREGAKAIRRQTRSPVEEKITQRRVCYQNND